MKKAHVNNGENILKIKLDKGFTIVVRTAQPLIGIILNLTVDIKAMYNWAVVKNR